MNLFVVIKEKRKKKKIFTLFLHSFASRSYRDITYGIRAKIKTLGPDGLINMQVCFQLCELIMWYYSAHYKNKYCWTLCTVSEYYVQCIKLVVCTKGYLSNLANEKMKALLGLSRESYTYVFYIRIDKLKCELKFCLVRLRA